MIGFYLMCKRRPIDILRATVVHYLTTSVVVASSARPPDTIKYQHSTATQPSTAVAQHRLSIYNHNK